MFQQVLLRIRNTTNLSLWKNLRETYLSLWKNLRETYLSLWKKKKNNPFIQWTKKVEKTPYDFYYFWNHVNRVEISLQITCIENAFWQNICGMRGSWLLTLAWERDTNYKPHTKLNNKLGYTFFFQCRSSFGHVIYVISICKFCVIMLNSLWLNIVNVAARFSDKCKNASNSGNKEINFTYKMHLMCKNMMLYIVHITYNHSHEVAIIVAPLFFFHFFFSNSLFYWIF